jgi:hypothetical protein
VLSCEVVVEYPACVGRIGHWECGGRGRGEAEEKQSVFERWKWFEGRTSGYPLEIGGWNLAQPFAIIFAKS